MKKKFLILTLCLTLCFTSINYKKSYADGGIISLPILATVSALAVGTGIVINNNDDLYDLGRLFYDYIDKHNDITWDMVKTVFSTSVVLANNKLVSVKSEFLDIVKGFFDNTFDSSGDIVIGDFTKTGFPTSVLNVPIELLKDGYSIGDFKFVMSNPIVGKETMFYIYQTSTGSLLYSSNTWCRQKYFNFKLGTLNSKGYLRFKVNFFNESGNYSTLSFPLGATKIIGGVDSFPYTGGYTWDNINDKKEENNISLPIPGNLGDLVGTPSDTFWDNTDNLVGDIGLSIPDVLEPSISVDDSVSFPSDVPSDVPSDIPFSSITDYIIGLVVPSDSYWTYTFNNLYGNFTTSFPMVDMDNFKNLVTGEKKFPNIDINIMGVKGRVVNGDVVNSIVDWLRPIVAGFMMLCLMLFNYRKIYKTIRGVEPFQGIAQGTSDFRTGISEYNYMGTGLSKSDYEANQMELAKALHDYEQDTGKTYKIKI